MQGEDGVHVMLTWLTWSSPAQLREAACSAAKTGDTSPSHPANRSLQMMMRTISPLGALPANAT